MFASFANPGLKAFTNAKTFAFLGRAHQKYIGSIMFAFGYEVYNCNSIVRIIWQGREESGQKLVPGSFGPVIYEVYIFNINLFGSQ